MRSGSTLLKALLATNSEVSDIAEVHFSMIHTIVSDKPFIVIKCPAYYNELDYPVLPQTEARKLLLIRNPYDTVMSLKRMNIATKVPAASPLHNEIILLSYWVCIYQNLIDKFLFSSREVSIIRYEDLSANPMGQTQKIFAFIGVKDTKGATSYHLPKNYKWKWGNDDGGDIIKTLKVQNMQSLRNNGLLLELIQKNKSHIWEIMNKFGYKDLCL